MTPVADTALTFCRDCLGETQGRRRCDRCGSPRVFGHPQLGAMTIAHVDCDAFFATVEKRDDPSLADKPVIVGGGRRGVVLTACYIARIRGVRSAMPMFKALKLCPDAVVVKPNFQKYVEASRAVKARMLALTPLVESLSIDEAFLDLAGTERVHHAPPALALARFAAEVEREVGVTVSIGMASNKFLAKIASELDKPRGFAALSIDEAPAFLAPKPIDFLWGVGPAFARSLARDGLRTIADLQRAGREGLLRRHGEQGARLARLAFGEDSRRVEPNRARKSVGAESTFETDVAEIEELEARLFRLCEKVAGRLRADAIAGSAVTLKLKTTDFRIRTRAQQLSSPTRLAARIFEAARAMLKKEADGTAFRLIGVAIADLGDAAAADPPDLERRNVRLDAIETAVADLRARFGPGSVDRAFARDRQRKPDRQDRR